MLFVLTGDVKTGKTRWLQELVKALQSEGVSVCGVLAPGAWADRRDDPISFPHADANGFEKLGIDNVLLPGDERVAFARRVDLATSEGAFDPNSESGKAKLGWQISDMAIGRVNEHFSALRTTGENASAHAPALLVIDELGRLELECGGGLTEAVAMLEDGPTDAMQHALIVVRKALLPSIEGRFESWGEPVHLAPNDKACTLVLDSVMNFS